ncbi:MAG: hypothetical protein ABWX73_12740 [Marmoricola sp.]
MLESSARRAHLRAAAGVFALGLLVSGCAEEKKAAPAPEPTPIANLNTRAMDLPRIEFCGLVPEAAVTEALGGKADADASYGNGDEEELPDIGTVVLHELGCSWTGEDGTTARAWVFARPISPAFARTVVDAGKRTPGCRTVTGPEFGTPSATQVCEFDQGRKRVRHAGLFGQSWLSCELAAKGEMTQLRTRTDAWCVDVVNALNTSP